MLEEGEGSVESGAVSLGDETVMEGVDEDGTHHAR